MFKEYLTEAYAEARREVDGKEVRRRGRKWFTEAQALAVGRWMDKTGFPIRATRQAFMDSPDVPEALGMRGVPSRDWFHRALKTARRSGKASGI